MPLLKIGLEQNSHFSRAVHTSGGSRTLPAIAMEIRRANPLAQLVYLQSANGSGWKKRKDPKLDASRVTKTNIATKTILEFGLCNYDFKQRRLPAAIAHGMNLETVRFMQNSCLVIKNKCFITILREVFFQEYLFIDRSACEISLR